MQSWEILPLEVGNVMCLGIGQRSGSKTDIQCGKLARSTWLGLDIIIIFQFGMPLTDARNSGAVYVKLFGDGIISHPIFFEMDDSGLFRG